MPRFDSRQHAWEWAERNAQGNCSVLVRFNPDAIMIFEYLADDFGFFRSKGYL